MKRKLFLLPALTLMLLASCSNSTPTKYHFNVGCVNCTVNFENSLSIDVNENENARFALAAKEGYLLPTEVTVTSGNEVLLRNVDYTYLLNEDRFTGEITIKANKAIDIYIDADEQGYLYIGNNKISKSGDYSKLDHKQFGFKDASDSIIYDYKTNTLTLYDAYIHYETAGIHDFDYTNDIGYSEFDSDKIAGLIGWTGGGSFTLKLLGENYFYSKGEDYLETVIVAPLSNDATLNIVGPGTANFSNTKHSSILNQRGKTYIDNVSLNGNLQGYSGIYSKDLFISNSHINLTGTTQTMECFGILASYITMNRSYCEMVNFGYGIQSSTLSIIDTDIRMSDVYTGIATSSAIYDGYKINDRYSTNIVIEGTYQGISSINTIVFNCCYLDIDLTQGYCILTPATTIEAYDCYIDVTSENEGVGLNAYQIWLTNCNVVAKAKLALFSSLNGFQEEGREAEPNIEIDNTSIIAKGEIYGNGHFKATNCKDEENYKYLEKEVDSENEQYLWALCPTSETELKYDVFYDEYDRPYYYPTNALDHVVINAEHAADSQQSEPTTHICDPEKTARFGLGVDICDRSSYYNSDKSIEIWGLSFYKNFDSAADEIQLEYWAMLYHKYFACATFTIVIVDKDGNEIAAFRNHCFSGEGMPRVKFTRDYCIRGNNLALLSFIQDYKETGLQNYQVYLESISID